MLCAMLRPVEPGDLEVFYRHQADPPANAMAAFPARDREAHMAHWRRLLADDTLITRTVVDDDGVVVGNVGCWPDEGEWHVSYWIGREHWGRGLATRALAELLAEVDERPLHARVAEHNAASIRVLVKCGFSIVGTHREPGDEVTEVLLRLDRS
jgi:RimJ/RimL family protein N-acetyltransferase